MFSQGYPQIMLIEGQIPLDGVEVSGNNLHNIYIHSIFVYVHLHYYSN